MSTLNPIPPSIEKSASSLGNDATKNNKCEINTDHAVTERLDLMRQNRKKNRPEIQKLDPKRWQPLSSSDVPKCRVVTSGRLIVNKPRFSTTPDTFVIPEIDFSKTPFPKKPATPLETLEQLRIDSEKALVSSKNRIERKRHIEKIKKNVSFQGMDENRRQSYEKAQDTFKTLKKLAPTSMTAENRMILEPKKSISYIKYPAKGVKNSLARASSDRRSNHGENSLRFSVELSGSMSNRKECDPFTPVNPEVYIEVGPKVLKSRLAYLSGITSNNFFNKTTAEEELSHCIQCSPTQYEDIANILKKIQSQLAGNRLHRLHDVFCLALPKSNNAAFLSYYFSRALDADVDVFAQAAIPQLRKKKNADEMLQLLDLYTRVDLGWQSEDRDTLFRNNWLSSALCQQYANVIWETEIARIRQIVADELKMNGKNLCLDQGQIKTELELKVADFSQFNVKKQKKRILKVLDENETHFVNFLRHFIPEIHRMSVPTNLSNLFKMRRQRISNSIENKLKKGEDLNNVSRIYTSELVFLRLINPAILSDKNINPAILSVQNPTFTSVKINIIKMIQSLANEVRPEHDKMAKVLIPVYDEFIVANRKFLDTHSLETVS